MAKINFEEWMRRLEEIVESLEKGDLSLEDALEKYESGIKIYKQCMSLLNGIEKKIQILTKKEDGADLSKGTPTINSDNPDNEQEGQD